MSTVPAERLAQIAARKLNALKLPSKILPDGCTVEGMFTFTPGRVVNPVSGVPVGRSRFRVIGHDRLQFTDAPLTAMEPVPFYDANAPADVEHLLAAALQRRGEFQKAAAARFERMRLAPKVDPDDLSVRARIDAPGIGFFELESDPGGTWVRRVMESGKEYLLDRQKTRLDLDEFAMGVDLELHLSERLSELKAAQRVAASADGGGAAARVVLEEVPAAAGVPVLGELLRAFGAGATLVPGERVQVQQEFSAGAVHYRFVAQQEAGMTFRAQLIGPRGVMWGDRIDISRFPGAKSFVASTLGVPLAEAPAVPAAGGVQTSAHGGAPAAAPASSAGIDASATSVPVLPGEIWVMAVLVEHETEAEVRYVCTDPEGRPYGAARVLGRADFRRIFAPHRGGWRLRIRIEAVQGAQVVYRQLDTAGNPAPQPKALNVQVLQGTFMPEAADY